MIDVAVDPPGIHTNELPVPEPVSWTESPLQKLVLPEAVILADGRGFTITATDPGRLVHPATVTVTK